MVFVNVRSMAEKFPDMGIDTIFTNNDYNRIAQVVEKREKYVTY